MIFRKRITFIVHFFLSLTLLFLGILVLSQVDLVYSDPYTDIDVISANNMITNGSYPNLIILDARIQIEYVERHLENSILIPVENSSQELMKYHDTKILK